MDKKYYTSERHIQILIYLMKAHGIRKIIASPGTTNLTFIGSVQNDSYFEVFSSVDERSAAYLACGLAAESGEPVAISCTGATASRNYFSALTEAYYRKLPILAITSTQHPARIGQYAPQVIDRTIQPRDTVYMSKHISIIDKEEDSWQVTVSINEALLELKHRGGGPVHLNVETSYSRDFSIKDLPPVRIIKRINYCDNLPDLPNGRIGIFVGAHNTWSEELTESVDRFCERFGAVVFCDQTSNYKGKYGIFPSLVCSQDQYFSSLRKLRLLLHVGSVSGADMAMNGTENYDVWRINPDGKVRDTFQRLKYVFEMEEEDFFNKYLQKKEINKTSTYFEDWRHECTRIESKIPELPFSNVWIAKETIRKFPEGVSVYFAILNSLRCWNYFKAPYGIVGYSNTGGFGIDGGLSTLIGSSFANREKLYFCIMGDLGFFYDMNSLGIRHLGNNVRILLINNGRGTEFTNFNHLGATFGENAKTFFAAAGHFGNQSRNLVKHFATDLGLEYLSAENKKEYLEKMDYFVSSDTYKKSVLLEVFTNGEDESEAIRIMRSLEVDSKQIAKQAIKSFLGEKMIDNIRKIKR